MFSEVSKYHDFIYLGAHPIDAHKCSVSDEVCKINIGNILKNNKTKIGIVFNTDPSTKDGEHWISLYIDLGKHNHNHYGIYYFDSYGKKPKKQIVDRKKHYESDGMITFTNNTGTDYRFTNGQMSFHPVPGDMYIFPAMQCHMVWPYRSEDPNDSRISLSFNADYITESGLEKEKQQQQMMYEEMKKMKESENDKSADVSDINKSG